MKLYHLGLWMIVMPAFADTLPQTSGVLYVSARFVLTPCQPQVIVQPKTNFYRKPLYELKISFAHCANNLDEQSWVPFALKLAQKKYVFSSPPSGNTIVFPVPENSVTQRLEMQYD